MMTAMQSISLGFDGHTLSYYNSFVCVGVPYVGSGVSLSGRVGLPMHTSTYTHKKPYLVSLPALRAAYQVELQT